MKECGGWGWSEHGKDDEGRQRPSHSLSFFSFSVFLGNGLDVSAYF